MLGKKLTGIDVVRRLHPPPLGPLPLAPAAVPTLLVQAQVVGALRRPPVREDGVAEPGRLDDVAGFA